MGKIAAYKEILEVLDKNSFLFKDDTSSDIRSHVKGAIKTLELSNEFGVDIPDIWSYDWKKINEYTNIGFYDGVQRTIAWPDDGRQPKDEWLYVIRFPCGAYTFHPDYPHKTFDAFFEELKTFKPKYSDSHNHSLYFDKEHAKSVHDNFWDIFYKYKNSVGEELKAMRVKELEEQIAKLKGE